MIDHHNWYQHFFNGLALDLWYRAISPAYTQEEINFIRKKISIPDRAKILDMPCGFGRHTIYLAEQGFEVTGVDFSAEYIAHLQREASEKKLTIDILHLDMLDYRPDPVFDLVLCLGNSFSYFNRDKMKRFIRSLHSALKPGGKLVINTGSLADSIFLNLPQQNWMQVGDMLFLMKHEYDVLLGVLKTDMQFIVDNQKEKKTAYHFAYTLAEINQWLEVEQLRIREVFSDLQGNFYKLGDPQAYLFVEKIL